MTPFISPPAEASGSAAGRPLSSRTTLHTEASQLPLPLAAQLCPGIAVHTVVRADPGEFRAVAPHSHEERSYPPVARGRGLPDHDEPPMPRHLDPSVTEEEMIHLGRHPEFAGPDPRAHPDEVRMTMPQAIGITQATCASAELDHADLPRLAHRQPLGWQVTARRTPTSCALPLLAATLNQCGMRLCSRGSGTPDEPDCADACIQVDVTRHQGHPAARQPTGLRRLTVDHAPDHPRQNDLHPAVDTAYPTQLRAIGHVYTVPSGEARDDGRWPVRSSRSRLPDGESSGRC